MKHRPTRLQQSSLRLLMASLVLLALLVRGSLPVGFMPVFGADNMVSIEICTGSDVKQMLLKASDMPGAEHSDKSGCAYAMALAPTLDAIAAITIPPIDRFYAPIAALEIASQYRSLNRVYLAQGPPVA